MTKFTLKKDIITQVFNRKTYKLLVIFYSLYFMFSTQAFALQVEAPANGMSFGNVDVIEALQPKKLTDDIRAEKIRLYYARYDLPLQDYAEHFVEAADTYGIDWRLVAAIGFIESTGGKHACKTARFSAFGWGSCKINFDSYEHSIDVISMNLGGHNPKTAKHYEGKTTRQILEAYNPPSVVPDYADKVMRQMAIIDAQIVESQ